MKCDPTLLREIKLKAGKTKQERLAFVAQCAAFADELGKAIKENNGLLSLKTIYDRETIKYPRAVNACCVASTIILRQHDMSQSAKEWALDVISAWTPIAGHQLRAYIDDNLNPTRIEEYAGSFIRCTSV